MKSPLYTNAIELLAHATEHFTEKDANKYKFVILHLANAVELILKDRLVLAGRSIYNKNSRTFNIWECFKELTQFKIEITERPALELLIDDRNHLQHLFGHPNEAIVFYYFRITVDFFDRFLKEEYDESLLENLKEYLTEVQLDILGLEQNEFDYLVKLKETSIEMAILQVSSDLEKIVYKITKPYRESKIHKSISTLIKINRPAIPIIYTFIKFLKQDKEVKKEDYHPLKNDYYLFQNYRNQIAHGRLKPDTGNDILENVFDSGFRVLSVIKKAYEKKFFTDDKLDEMFGLTDEE